MSKTLSNRIRLAEQTATMKATRRTGGPSGLGELYRRMQEEPHTLSPQMQRLLQGVTP